MKTINSAAIIFCLIFFCSSSDSQIGVSLGPSVGLTSPTGDYSGSTVDYYNGAKYGLSSGINFGGVVKLKLLILKIRGAVNHSSLSNSGNSEPSNPGSFVEIKHGLLLISAGPELSFSLPGSPIVPYIGADLLMSSLSGESTFRGVSGVPSGTYSMSSTSRFGLGLGGGVEFRLGRKYALDLGLRYNFLNLFGKNFEELPSDNRVDSYMNLNDDQDPNYAVDPDDHPVSNSRSISILQLNLTFLFDL
jgi:opacity protein-like surface antigen